MGIFALPLLVLLAGAEPLPGPDERVVVPPPARPIVIKPVPLESVAVVAEEPRYVAPTRLDQIGRIWAPVTVNGQGPYRLVLATGASNTAVTPHLAQELGVQADPSHTVMLRGSTGSVAVPVVPVEGIVPVDTMVPVENSGAVDKIGPVSGRALKS